jgi:Inner membrane protein YgaP-like, transmembrane domain
MKVAALSYPDPVRSRHDTRSFAMTLQPMLRLIAGVFVAVSVLLGMFVNQYFLWFTLFVGLNLTQSAFTSWCPMMSVLKRLGVRDNRVVFDEPAREFHR